MLAATRGPNRSESHLIVFTRTVEELRIQSTKLMPTRPLSWIGIGMLFYYLL